jgi:hypothetical protein
MNPDFDTIKRNVLADGRFGRARVTPLTVADCGDQYVRTPEGWRIAFRYVQPVAGAAR